MDNLPASDTANQFNIFNDIGHMIMVLDKHHNIVASNNAVSTALNKSEDELRGKKCHEIFHGTTKPPEHCPMQKALHFKSMEIYDMLVKTLDGAYLVSCTPIFDESGNIGKVIHMATDITKRKHAKEKIQKLNEELQQLVKEQTLEIEEANAEQERRIDLFVQRELMIPELRKQVAQLEADIELLTSQKCTNEDEITASGAY